MWNYEQRYQQVMEKIQKLKKHPIVNANYVNAIRRDLVALSNMADELKCSVYSAAHDAFLITRGMRIKNPSYYIEDDYYDDEY